MRLSATVRFNDSSPGSTFLCSSSARVSCFAVVFHPVGKHEFECICVLYLVFDIMIRLMIQSKGTDRWQLRRLAFFLSLVSQYLSHIVLRAHGSLCYVLSTTIIQLPQSVLLLMILDINRQQSCVSRERDYTFSHRNYQSIHCERRKRQETCLNRVPRRVSSRLPRDLFVFVVAVFFSPLCLV